MQVPITEENILKYNLVEYTGNSKEALLLAAAEAEEAGYVLTCTVPDDSEAEVLHTNIFEAADSVPVPLQQTSSQCVYSERFVEGFGNIWICRIHGRNSKYEIEPGSHKPCLVVDPY